jgi:hypothetical protein
MKMILSLVLLLWGAAYSQVSISSYQVLSTPVGTYDKFEIEIGTSTPAITNPYNPAEISVSVEFKSPSNIISTANGFYYAPFSRCAGCTDPTIIPGDNCSRCISCADPSYLSILMTRRRWRIRFTPDAAGTWEYRIKVQHNGGTPVYSTWNSFSIAASSNKGYIKVAPNQRNFCFTNGNIFFPIGMNLVNYGSTV